MALRGYWSRTPDLSPNWPLSLHNCTVCPTVWPGAPPYRHLAVVKKNSSVVSGFGSAESDDLYKIGDQFNAREGNERE
jgi:hypothetical protein